MLLPQLTSICLSFSQGLLLFWQARSLLNTHFGCFYFLSLLAHLLVEVSYHPFLLFSSSNLLNKLLINSIILPGFSSASSIFISNYCLIKSVLWIMIV